MFSYVVCMCLYIKFTIRGEKELEKKKNREIAKVQAGKTQQNLILIAHMCVCVCISLHARAGPVVS
jgi:Ca2+/Na+ antiporter